MKRTALNRTGGLKRTGSLKRGKRINPVNVERAAKRRAEDFGDLADFVRSMDCCSGRCAGPSDPAHIRSRGAGGKAWTHEGEPNIIPLCRRCHTRQHAHGWAEIMGPLALGLAVGEVHTRWHEREFGAPY